MEELQQKTDMVLGDVYYVESENSDYYWNKLEWVDVGNRADLTDLATKTELNKMQTDLQYGTHIQEGQDLNDITQVGLYHSTNGATTNTLINCPIRDNGFRLEVITINIPNRLLQIINVNARDEIWIRRLNTLIASEDNGEWQKIAITKEVNEAKFDKTGEIIADCNNKNLDSGIYYTNNTTLNKPVVQSGSAGFLIVIYKGFTNGDLNIIQYWLRYRDRQVYERQCNPVTNNAFSEWEEVTGRYLRTTGGSITGNLTIGRGAEAWKEIGAERIIDATVYKSALGVGAGKSLALMLSKPDTNEMLNRIDLRADGKMINAVTGKEYLQDDDTGWKDLTLTSAFKKANVTNMNPIYRKVGKMVQITGAVTPTAEIAAGQATLISTLPSGFRPSNAIAVLCQGSGVNKWMLSIQPTGAIYIERYGITTNDKIPLNAWLPFNATFFVG